MEMKLRQILVGIASLVVMVSLTSPVYSKSVKVTLKEGSFVAVRLKQSLSSETCNRDEYIDLEVIQDVKVDGHVVIKAGATARGQIDECEKKGIAGKAGKLRLVLITVKSVDNQNIPLRGTASRVGEDKTMESVGGGLICPVFFLKKGETSSYPAGSEYQVYTSGDREITVK